MDHDDFIRVLVGLGIAAWLGALAFALFRRYRVAACLSGAVALMWLVPSLCQFLEWIVYPARFSGEDRAELPRTVVLATLTLFAFLASFLAYRGRLRWSVLAWLLNAPALFFLFVVVFLLQIHF